MAGFQVIMYGRFWVITEVLNSVGAAFTHWDNVIRLHLYATESVADAAAAMDSDQEFVNFDS